MRVAGGRGDSVGCRHAGSDGVATAVTECRGAGEGEGVIAIPPQMEGEGVEAEYKVDLSNLANQFCKSDLTERRRTLINHPATSTAAANPLSSFQS